MSPVVMKACHTIIGYQTVTAEMRHRLHMYQDQGFFHEAVVSGVEAELDDRLRELARYVRSSVATYWHLCRCAVCCETANPALDEAQRACWYRISHPTGVAAVVAGTPTWVACGWHWVCSPTLL